MVAAIESRTLLRQRYLIKQLLGQGGFGRTYLALDRERFDEPCVLKEFTVSYQDESLVEKAKALFAREASILHQVQHPQIPRFWAAFEWEDRLFLVQDYVQGENYRTLLQTRRDRGETLNEVEVLHLLNHLLPVLSYLHDRDIVHRDISPENLVLSPAKGASENPQTSSDYTAGLPVLLDFGSVKAATSGLALVSSMTRVGKVGYAPPEQLQTGQVQPHSDLYALAATCIVLLTGREPHQLLDSLTLDWNWLAYTSVSREFANILNRMLALHPGDRYASATAVHSDLQRLLGVLTPMIWRPEYVSWQGFASPIHQRATANLATTRTAKSTGAIKTELPPTHLQTKPREKISRFFSRHFSQSPVQQLNERFSRQRGHQTGNATTASEITSDGNVATLPPRTDAPSHQLLQQLPPIQDWSPRWMIAASCLAIGSIGISIFRMPLESSYQFWPSQPTASPKSITAKKPRVEATGPQTIEFTSQEVAAAVQGNLQENQTRIYRFRASKTQIMAVTLEGSGVKMNLLRADQSPIDNSSRQIRNWTGQLPASEVYQIQITGSGAYSLDMAISPNQKPQVETNQRLRFDHGSTKTVTGEVLTSKQRRYVFSAKTGQNISFKVLQGNIQLKLITPTQKPLGSSQTAWKGKAPVKGDYTIIITSKKREDYAVSVELK
ncbi:serine/threonine protein kinase [filamentous cyanobacterium LEGE 11480]|uniref:non-specific serine/threonine protein kinase n=1 Tax=Romeriopsis navalis LEGE 11480 TaxID=2777977 RepID=A0A928Z4N6_9CYAN|nr:serine/threonine-protein kinase [Romeriopsis navalis]MBE9030558.1 serine/threonine protein kinase [Romeriopsis navalis LEGE 11480]